MIRFAVIGTNTITDKFLQAASALSIPERLRGRRSMHKKITFRLSLILWRRWPTQTRSTQSTSPAPISAMLPRAS